MRLVNTIRATLKVFGHKPVRCAAESVAHRMASHIPAELHPILNPLLTTLQTVNKQIQVYDEQLRVQGEGQFPEVRALQQIHGVGPLLSLAFVTAIGDLRRFKDPRSVGAYLGPTPKSRQSGGSDPSLRISKEGDGMVRGLLVTAATHILRGSAPDTDLKRFGKRLAASGTPRDKARARIAVALKLAILLRRLWLTGEVYDPLHATQQVHA